MSNKMNKYLRQVSSWLPCNRRTKKAILANLREMMINQLGSATTVDMQTLTSRFGTPQQIASAHVDEMETPELLHQLRIRRRIVTIILLTAITILAIWIGVALIALVDALNSNRGYYLITILNQ